MKSVRHCDQSFQICAVEPLFAISATLARRLRATQFRGILSNRLVLTPDYMTRVMNQPRKAYMWRSSVSMRQRGPFSNWFILLDNQAAGGRSGMRI